MWIAFYNPRGVGDVLMLMCQDVPSQEIAIEEVGDVTHLYHRETRETVGYNIHNVSNLVTIEGQGPVKLTAGQIERINQNLYDKNFATIDYQDEAKIVVGYVDSCQPMENSDHLNITQTRVDDAEEARQIVCGASNVRSGMRVVVALPGAVMPDGSVISPGELRGYASYGMLCSAYELGLDPDRQRPGILEIKDSVPLGTPIDEITPADFA
ncbi:tRNA-binding protein [Aerococcus urinaehominis]|nr:DUF4479 and tRNA-binding domain-containing protein [Aerococcus urinaehominis]SDL86678.1 tRNA-binding protein [Aerococcus urinaehominis]